MARGDVTFFQEAPAYMVDGDWTSTDDIKCAILDNTWAPAADDASPALGSYTQVGTGGTYVSGGTSLGNLAAVVIQAGAVTKIDSATNPSWAQDAGNDTDAYWGLVYNATTAGSPAICFVDLGGPVDMTAEDLTITWNASGIATITIT